MQPIRQFCGKAITTPQNSWKLGNIRQTQAAPYVYSGSKLSQTPHSPYYLCSRGKANAELIRGGKCLLNGVPALNLVIHSVVHERQICNGLPAMLPGVNFNSI